MNLKLVFLAICLVVLLVGIRSVQAAPTNVSACGSITSAGMYELNQSLYITGARCLNITVSDVFLDCKGFSIQSNGSGSGEGIYAQVGAIKNNITVQGCVIQNFTHGIFFQGANNSVIRANTVVNHTANGIRLDGQPNNTAIYNNTVGSTVTGIVIVGGNNTHLYNNSIFSASGNGIMVQAGYRNSQSNITNNSIWNGTAGSGIEDMDNFARIESNTVWNSTGTGILVNGAINATARNNTVANFTGASNVFGIRSISGHNATVANNTVYNISIGVQVENTNNANVFGNVVTNTTNTALALSNGTTDVVYNNNVSFASGLGIRITARSSSNNVSYNFLYNSTDLRLDTLSTDNLIGYNTIRNTTGGILSGNSSLNRFYYNDIRFTTGTGFILTENATNNTVENNSIRQTGTEGFFITLNSNNNTLRNNNASYAQTYGFRLFNASFDNTIINSTAIGAQQAGLIFDNVSRNVVIGGNFSDNQLGGGNPAAQVQVLNSAQNNTIYNATVSGSVRHLAVNVTSSIVLVNVTLDRSKVDVFANDSNATYRIYVTARGTSSNGTGLSSATLTVANTTNLNTTTAGVSTSETTGSDGGIAFQNLIEGFQTNASIRYQGVYNFTASRFVAYNSTTFNVSSVQAIALILNSSPGVTLTTPPDLATNTSRNMTFTYVPIDNETNLSNCSLWTNQTSWSLKSSNASAVVNGTNNSVGFNSSSEGWFLWNVQCYDNDGQSAFDSANRTLFVNASGAPTVTLSSPAAGFSSTSVSDFSFSYADNASLSANCSLFLDGVLQTSNASTLNATSTSLSTTAAVGSHSWLVQCTDLAGNAANSSSQSFTVTSTSNACTTCSGSSSPSPTVAPTAAPTPAPAVSVASPAPVPTPPASVSEVTPTPQPTSAPEPIKAEEVAVVVETPDKGVASVQPVAVTQALSVQEVKDTRGLSGFVSVIAVFVENKGNATLKKVEVTQRYPFVNYLGPDPDNYPFKWNPRPVRIEPGSAVVTWLFDNVEPGQTVKAEFTVEGKVERKEIEKLATPKVIAKVASVKAQVQQTATVRPEIKPASSDSSLPLIAAGVLIIVGVAYFLFLRKKRGL